MGRGRENVASPTPDRIQATFPFGEVFKEIFKCTEIFKPAHGKRPTSAPGQQNRNRFRICHVPAVGWR